MAINDNILNQSWEGREKSFVEDGLKTLLGDIIQEVALGNQSIDTAVSNLTQEINKRYIKPNTGIPADHLEQAVRDVLASVANKVDNDPDKGLSTNDFTTTLLNKLNLIEDGAQVNVINGIQTHDGQSLTPNNGVVTLPEQAEVDMSDYYDKDEVDAAIDDKLTEVTIHSWPAGRISMAIVGNKLVIDGVVPSVSLSPSSLELTAESGQQATGTIHVQGSNLDGDVTLALSGASYMSFEASSVVTSKTIAKATAEAGVDVTIYYTGTASDSGTITASSTGATSATASVSGSVIQRLNEGDTFAVNGLTFTVLADTTKVSVKATSSSSLSGAVTIPSTATYDGVSYDVTAIADAGFNGCSITSIVLPDSIATFLGWHTFYGCSNLTSIDLGNGLESIEGANAFYNTKLVNVVFPDSFKSGGKNAFQSTSMLQSIQLGKTTAFSPTDIKEILHFAGSVTDDNSQNTLTTVTCYAETPPTLWYAPNGSTKPTLKVPSGSVSSYQSASGWSSFSSVEAI